MEDEVKRVHGICENFHRMRVGVRMEDEDRQGPETVVKLELD